MKESRNFDQCDKDGKTLTVYIEQALSGDETKLHDPLVNIGFLKIAFQWAFYYLHKNASYEDALKDILMRGGDTDTNAAIIGGLLGARDGESKLNKAQVAKVLSCFAKDAERRQVERSNFELFVPALHLRKDFGKLYESAPKELHIMCQGQKFEPSDFRQKL